MEKKKLRKEIPNLVLHTFTHFYSKWSYDSLKFNKLLFFSNDLI